MSVVASTRGADWEEKVKDAAFRIANSHSFQTFFVTHDSPAQWEAILRQWDDDALDSAILIVKEEEEMLKDLALQKARKEKVNDTRLLQRIEQMRVKAHQTK